MIDPISHPDRELVDYIHSNNFFWWTFFSIIMMIAIVGVRCLQATKVDFITIMKNSNIRGLAPHNRYFLPLLILSHFEMAFVYHVHYQIFNFYYHAIRNPCLGMVTSDGKPIIFDTTIYLLTGETGKFIQYAFFTFGFFFILHFIGVIFFSLFPVRNAQIFTTPIHVILRFISFFLGVIIICRIGALLVISPTYAKDEYSIIGALYSGGNFNGIVGFFPELFELMVIIIDLALEYIFFCIDHRVDDGRSFVNGTEMNTLKTQGPYNTQGQPYRTHSGNSQNYPQRVKNPDLNYNNYNNGYYNAN